MRHPNFILLYVSNVADSTVFYQELLSLAPIESSPGFAMFALENGLMLGLWAKQNVLPMPNGAAGSSEIAFTVDHADEVKHLHQTWSDKKIAIAQIPTAMDFGYTCVALDPDGHRIRVFAPS